MITCTIDILATGQNIKRLMLAKGMTVKDLKKALGFTTGQAIYKWFHGQSLPTLDNILIVSKMLGATIDEIIIEEG